MVISYMAGTSAGAQVILQSTQLIPASPRGVGEGDEGARDTVLEGRDPNDREGTSNLAAALSFFAERPNNATICEEDEFKF